MVRPTALVLALAAASGCGGAAAPPPDSPAPAEAPAPPAPAAEAPPPPTSPAPGPPKPASGPMTREQAERYFLDLVNRDRAAHGLAPVRWDENAAAAGRRHAADMVVNGVAAHVGTDGSVPEQRYTDAGGEDLVMENAGCFSDGKQRAPAKDPRFLAADLERLQRSFMDEVPPHDGHKRNILNPRHTSVGIGLAEAEGASRPCVAQEFVDDYGEYKPIRRKARRGDLLRVEGVVRAPAKIMGVGLSRIDGAKPTSVEALRKMHGYAIPPPYATFFTAGFKTSRVVQTGPAPGAFSVEVPLDDGRRPGRYGVSVWASFPGSNDIVMVSLRLVDVE